MAEKRNTPSRRTMLAGLAAAPVAGLPALAGAVSGDDPIFAAIERHKAAEVRYCAACILTDEVAAAQQGREVTEADEAAYDAASDQAREALEALVGTIPTSRAGARAALEYLLTFDRISAPPAVWRFAAALLASPVLAGGEALS